MIQTVPPLRHVTNVFAANRTSLPESELERFKKQAGCLGFSREPDYQYDAHKGAFHQYRPVSVATPPTASRLFSVRSVLPRGGRSSRCVVSAGGMPSRRGRSPVAEGRGLRRSVQPEAE